jgi:hypothetical protein
MPKVIKHHNEDLTSSDPDWIKLTYKLNKLLAKYTVDDVLTILGEIIKDAEGEGNGVYVGEAIVALAKVEW